MSCNNNEEKNNDKDAVIQKIHEGLDEVAALAKKAKEKYEKADDKTKKNILKGVAAASALLAGIIGLKTIKKSIKKHKETK